MRRALVVDAVEGPIRAIWRRPWRAALHPQADRAGDAWLLDLGGAEPQDLAGLDPVVPLILKPDTDQLADADWLRATFQAIGTARFSALAFGAPAPVAMAQKLDILLSVAEIEASETPGRIALIAMVGAEDLSLPPDYIGRFPPRLKAIGFDACDFLQRTGLPDGQLAEFQRNRLRLAAAGRLAAIDSLTADADRNLAERASRSATQRGFDALIASESEIVKAIRAQFY